MTRGRTRGRGWQVVGFLCWLMAACSAPDLGLVGAVPLTARGIQDRFAIEAGVTYEIDLECRLTLPFNSEVLELGEVKTGRLELEPAPSPFYTLGIRTEVLDAVVNRQDHVVWLELATLQPVPGQGGYEAMRDAGREAAFAALRKLRGPEVTEMDLVQARVREFYLSGTVAFRVPKGIKTEALDLERKVGGALVAFFIAPELPGEGLNLTLIAPQDAGYEIEASLGGACPRLVMRRDDYLR